MDEAQKSKPCYDLNGSYSDQIRTVFDVYKEFVVVTSCLQRSIFVYMVFRPMRMWAGKIFTWKLQEVKIVRLLSGFHSI